MKQQKSLLLFSAFFMLGQVLLAQSEGVRLSPDVGLRSATTPLRIIDKETLRGMAATTLAEALRFELNMEIEQSPEIGGARMRSFDLNSRYNKVLINGVPLSGSDMFAGHVDISSIALNGVERIEISEEPLDVEHGAGSLARIVNIVTFSDKARVGLSAYAGIYEQSLASEYNLKTKYGAKGRHVQQIGAQYHKANGLFFGADLQRDAFKGLWGDYLGNLHQSDYTSSRGYAWSPVNTINANAFVGYRHNKLSLVYRYDISNREVSAYGHVNQKAYVDGDFQSFYSANDQDNRYQRQFHHAQLKGKLWQDAILTVDISYQDADTRKRTKWVRTADNKVLDATSLLKLYGVKTWYSKGRLDKPIFSPYLDWTLGYEGEWTKAFTAAEAGTYTTREINNRITQLSGFTYLAWNPSENIRIQPAIRMAYQRQLSHKEPLPSLSLSYSQGQNRFALVAERVARFPNQRELFSYLDNEFNLLKGNTDLRPERGTLLVANWQYSSRKGDDLYLKTIISSTYRHLKDRIVIAIMPQTNPQQDSYQYVNRQKYQSWSNKLEVEADYRKWHLRAMYSLLGLRGNDFSDSKQYDRYLFHSEAGLLGRYNLSDDFWGQLNYRYVGLQPIYSFERENESLDISRVHNKAPDYHLADLHIGGSVWNRRLGISMGVSNLFNTKAIDFDASDGKEHYRGDLRTIYAGYGRSWTLYVGYQF